MSRSVLSVLAADGPMQVGARPLGWGFYDRSEAVQVIHAPLDGRRERAVIAPKCGYVPDEATGDISLCRDDAAYVRDAC